MMATVSATRQCGSPLFCVRLPLRRCLGFFLNSFPTLPPLPEGATGRRGDGAMGAEGDLRPETNVLYCSDSRIPGRSGSMKNHNIFYFAALLALTAGGFPAAVGAEPSAGIRLS